ncbi:MAG: hypothetical protein P1T08_14270 [Acidimicrobiia bacterium]|nr:hypothetical protein [Acidimicrobiia bacterium]
MNIESDKSVSVDEREETVRAAAPLDETVTEPPLDEDEAVTESEASAPAAAHEVAARAETVRTVRTTRFTPSAVVAAVVAIAMLVLGGITVGRAGFDGSLGQPVVTVAGFTATALLGLIVFGFGAVLLIAALARQRQLILGLGIIGGVAGLIAVFEPTIGGDSLSIQRELGIWTAIAMAAIVVSALLPTVSRVNTRQTTEVK